MKYNTVTDLEKAIGVVICLKISIFVLWSTTSDALKLSVSVLWFAWKLVSLYYEVQHSIVRISSAFWLWFAWKLVSLYYEVQPVTRYYASEVGCDLLEN